MLGIVELKLDESEVISRKLEVIYGKRNSSLIKAAIPKNLKKRLFGLITDLPASGLPTSD